MDKSREDLWREGMTNIVNVSTGTAAKFIVVLLAWLLERDKLSEDDLEEIAGRLKGVCQPGRDDVAREAFERMVVMMRITNPRRGGGAKD